MRLLAFAFCSVAGNAYAVDYTRTVKSGQSTKMHVYRSWTTDCKSKLGIVKVLSKPSHGTLTPTEVTASIGISRNNPERTAHCKGQPTNGFRVDYVSDRGFRGTDHFKIEFTHGRYVDVDNYTVDVR
jgi:hypothetical protein